VAVIRDVHHRVAPARPSGWVRRERAASSASRRVAGGFVVVCGFGDASVNHSTAAAR